MIKGYTFAHCYSLRRRIKLLGVEILAFTRCRIWRQAGKDWTGGHSSCAPHWELSRCLLWGPMRFFNVHTELSDVVYAVKDFRNTTIQGIPKLSRKLKRIVLPLKDKMIGKPSQPLCVQFISTNKFSYDLIFDIHRCLTFCLSFTPGGPTDTRMLGICSLNGSAEWMLRCRHGTQ